MLLALARGLHRWFQPTIDALTVLNIPWTYRWRLLALQPVTLIAYSITTFPYIFSRPFKEEWLPVSTSRTIRALVFDDPSQRAASRGKLRPLHLHLHAGAFVGGIPEDGAPFCARLARETGAIVISSSYRLAPRHPFPAAIDDADAVVQYLQAHARGRWGADPELMTTSGGSAGGNLALAVSQQPNCHSPAQTSIKGSVTFYASIDLRLRPQDKPKSEALLASKIKRDPMAFLMPLYDAYPASERAQNMENPRMSPAIASLDSLPEDMLLVVAALDIVVHEQLTFVERLKEEIARDPKHAGRRVEALYIDKAFHGYLSLPSSIVTQELKDKAFDGGIDFLKYVHKKHGWTSS